MKTRILSLTDSNSMIETLTLLNNGGVVALPTDTVYGIACIVADAIAIKSIYQIKVRDVLKAVPVLLADSNQLPLVAETLSESAKILANAFWPGALTLIVTKKCTLPENLTVYSTVGVRIPDHDWLREVIRQSGPLAATSANISGQESPTSAQQVLKQLDGRIPLIIDGGACKFGKSSTVVDCTSSKINILRQGSLSREQIFSVLN